MTNCLRLPPTVRRLPAMGGPAGWPDLGEWTLIDATSTRGGVWANSGVAAITPITASSDTLRLMKDLTPFTRQIRSGSFTGVSDEQQSGAAGRQFDLDLPVAGLVFESRGLGGGRFRKHYVESRIRQTRWADENARIGEFCFVCCRHSRELRRIAVDLANGIELIGQFQRKRGIENAASTDIRFEVSCAIGQQAAIQIGGLFAAITERHGTARPRENVFARSEGGDAILGRPHSYA